MYEVPSAASGDAGIEGFSVLVEGRRVGRVAALNRDGGGLELVIDQGDGYRAAPLRAVDWIGLESRTVHLTPEGGADLAAAADVQVAARGVDSPRLVRHLPRELDPLLRAGSPAERPVRSRLRIPGIVLALVGGVGIWICAPAFAAGVGGSVRWLWLAVPAGVFVLGLVLLWRSLGPGAKASDALSFVLGISPRTRRRG